MSTPYYCPTCGEPWSACPHPLSTGSGLARCLICGRRATMSLINKKGIQRYYCAKHDPNYEPADDRFTPGGSPIFY